MTLKNHKYISRHDYNHTHGYCVRIFDQCTGGTNKLFSDGQHGGKLGAYWASIAYRDLCISKLPRELRLRVKHWNKPNYWSKKDYFITRKTNHVGVQYDIYTSSVYSKFTKKYYRASFSAPKYGAKEAQRLAIKARNRFKRLVKKQAKQRGIF